MQNSAETNLAPAEIERGLKYVIRDGLASQAMATLTGGVFLTDFALRLGASNLMIGMMAAIPALAQWMQMPAIYLVERLRKRRALTLYSVIVSRSFLLLLAAIPFLSGKHSLLLLLTALAAHWIFVALGGCSWNSWMRDLIPEERLGVFFSQRLAWAAALGVLLSLAAGWFITAWKGAYAGRVLQGYSVLFAGGWLAGMAGVYLISRIPEPPMPSDHEPAAILSLLRRPFADGNFRNLIAFLGPWNFAVNLVSPFLAVYMLKFLGVPLSRVIALTVLYQAVYFVFLRIWGQYADRFSNKTVLNLNGLLFLSSILAWAFTAQPGKGFFSYPLLTLIHILMGISASGATLAAGNIGMKMAPRGRATTYLASLSVINALAAGSAPVLGGKFVDFIAQRDFSLAWKWTPPGFPAGQRLIHFQPWDFLFVFAFGVGLYCLHRLSQVKEVGEVHQELLIRELIVEMRSKGLRVFSAATGLRQLFQMPSGFKRPARRRKSAKIKQPTE